MARVATQTRIEAEAACVEAGLYRVSGYVTTENRGLVRKWLVACGLPSDRAHSLTLTELGRVWRDTSDDALRALLESPADRDPGVAMDIADIAGQLPVYETPNPVATPPAPSGSIDEAIRKLVESVTPRSAPIDESAVKRIVAAAILEATLPKTVRVERPDRDPVIVKGAHPVFERVLKLVLTTETANMGVMLVGPAGSGKTRIMAEMGKALGRNYCMISGSGGVSESVITGWLLPSDGGRFDYASSRFVDCYESGESLIAFDEIDAFDPNMLLAANSAMANGQFPIPQRRSAPMAKRGEDVAFIASANTWGTGANMIYAGRNQLDGASLDRWIKVWVDYDRGFEESYALGHGMSAEQIHEIWTLRDKVAEKSLRRIVSTRAILGACAMLEAGDDWRTVMATLTLGWTADEKSQAGLAAH
jgi:cobaltochelatase CobS